MARFAEITRRSNEQIQICFRNGEIFAVRTHDGNIEFQLAGRGSETMDIARTLLFAEGIISICVKALTSDGQTKRTREDVLLKFYNLVNKAESEYGNAFLQYSNAVKDAFDECTKALVETEVANLTDE